MESQRYRTCGCSRSLNLGGEQGQINVWSNYSDIVPKGTRGIPQVGLKGQLSK